jgi:hypothetical protein
MIKLSLALAEAVIELLLTQEAKIVEDFQKKAAQLSDAHTQPMTQCEHNPEV